MLGCWQNGSLIWISCLLQKKDTYHFIRSVTYDEQPKMKRLGISLHFRAFVVHYRFSTFSPSYFVRVLSTIYLQRWKLRWQFCYNFFTHFNALGSIICSIWLIRARQPVPFKTFVNNAVCNTLDSCPFKFVLLRRRKKKSLKDR